MCMNKKPILFGAVFLFAVLALLPGSASEGPAVLEQGGTVFVSFLNTYADTGDPSAPRIGWIGWNVEDASFAVGGAETEQTVSGVVGGELTSVVFGAQAGDAVTTQPAPLAGLEASIVALGRDFEESVETYVSIAFEVRVSASSEPTWLYEWDFDGDGDFDLSGSSPTVSHAYDDDGVYIVQVAIHDNAGGRLLSKGLEIVVANRAPRAALETTNEPIVEQQPIAFIDASNDLDGSIASWSWDFGDGTGSSEAAPVHAYAVQGIYTVRLIVVDDDGAASDPYTMAVSVENAPPVAAFRADALDAGSGTVRFVDESFDPSPDGAIVHVAWDFGDGTYQTGHLSGERTYLHPYALPGAYDVTLYVIDRDGSLSILTQQVFVPSA